MPDQVQEDGGRDASVEVPGTIVFHRMRESHERAAQRYRLVALALLGVGIVLALAGLVAGGGLGLWLLIVGIMALAVAVLPFNESLEQGERAEGISVLREEWVAAGTEPATVAPRRSEILELISSLYVSKKSD